MPTVLNENGRAAVGQTASRPAAVTLGQLAPPMRFTDLGGPGASSLLAWPSLYMILTPRATTRPSVSNEIVACAIMETLALCERIIVSVGLNAVPVLNARKR